MQGKYDCYLDYSVILPQQTGFDMDGGLMAYDGRDIYEFINENFGADGCEYVDVDDSYELREAFETDDRLTIAKYMKKYPKLWVF